MPTHSKVIARTDRQTDRQTHIHRHTHDKNITSTAYAGGNYHVMIFTRVSSVLGRFLYVTITMRDDNNTELMFLVYNKYNLYY